jgi:hypothetical protein
MLCKGKNNTKGEYLTSMISGGGWITNYVIGGEVREDVDDAGLGGID